MRVIASSAETYAFVDRMRTDGKRIGL
ncbi:MAG: hypothetical protein RLZZ396_153, partial [Planctomycetota bacterium]